MAVELPLSAGCDEGDAEAFAGDAVDVDVEAAGVVVAVILDGQRARQLRRVREREPSRAVPSPGERARRFATWLSQLACTLEGRPAVRATAHSSCSSSRVHKPRLPT